MQSRRGLVLEPERWAWSSYRSYALGEDWMVKINQWPKAAMKIRTLAPIVLDIHRRIFVSCDIRPCASHFGCLIIAAAETGQIHVRPG
jgi:hypothetical protein